MNEKIYPGMVQTEIIQGDRSVPSDTINMPRTEGMVEAIKAINGMLKEISYALNDLRVIVYGGQTQNVEKLPEPQNLEMDIALALSTSRSVMSLVMELRQHIIGN